MPTLYILFFLLATIDIAALLWGADRSDGINSKEWERRQNWFGIL
jgi:hypothetical protein